MQVDLTPEQNSRVRLTITLSPEEVDRVIDSTYKKLANRVRVPGFRPGKAPRALLQRSVGPESFFHEATDEALRRYYPQALDQSGVKPLDQADVNYDDEHVADHQPFTFTATVPVTPEVQLPDYHTIKLPAPPVIVTDVDVDDVITRLREARATLESAPAKDADIGDVLVLNLHGRVEGNEILNSESFEFELVPEDQDAASILPGLSRELVGAHVGDIRDIALSLPADYQFQDVAGKSMFLKIIVKEVKRKILPALTDELAQEMARGVDTVAGLRQRIRDNLLHERTEEQHRKVSNDVMDSMIGRTPIQVPDVLISEEQDTLFDEQKRYIERIGLNFDQFLLTAGKSADQFKDELRDAAEKRVRRNLILDAIIEAEHIEPPSEKIDADVRQLAEDSAKSERDYDRLLQSSRLRHVIEENAARQLALAHLVQVVTGVDMQHDHVHEHAHDDEDYEDSESVEAEPLGPVVEESAVEAGAP